MKRFLIFSLLCSFMLLPEVAFGQKVTTTPERVEVGEVDKTKTVSFYLHNNSDAPLVITNVDASCGCTKIKYSKKPIAPSDSTKLTLRYTADKNDVGVFYKTMCIYTTAEDKPLKVSVRGTNKRQ